jgi:uncharacterized protein (TIGR03435 family)
MRTNLLHPLLWCLLALVAHGAAQTRNAAPPAPRFDVVSLKHVGSYRDGGRVEGSIHYTRPSRPVQLTGTRLSGEVPLNLILRFAFSPLVSPYYCEAPQWMNEEYYAIDAIAPAGTTDDAARAMLRTALADRLGLQYHMTDREKKILILLRGNAALKLLPSTEPEPNPGLHRVGVFKNKSASLSDFAGFLSSMTDFPVVDKTGIPGRFNFDIDWSQKIEGPPGSDPSLAYAGAQKLGLKLEASKDLQKTLVIDRANKEPTPN